MNQSIATVLAALLGAFVGSLGAATISGVINTRIERSRQRAASHDALVAEVRRAVAEASRPMFAILHQIQNLCWFADNYAERIESLIEPYYTAVDAAWPEVYGSLAVVASLSPQVYEQLKRVMDELMAFEARVGTAIEDYRRSPGDKPATQRLAACHSESMRLRDTLFAQLTATLESAAGT